MKRTIEEKLLNPKPGSKIAAAQEFGIDLSLLVRNLRLTPNQRVENLQRFSQNFNLILKSLVENKAEFVIIGEMASFFYGWNTVALKLEILYSRTVENLKRIVTALSPFKPKPRDSTENLSYVFDERTLQNETNFIFDTEIGDVDLLGEVTGVGTYDAVNKEAEIKNFFGYNVKILSIKGLIKSRRAAGRVKDLLVLPELEALLEVLSDEED